MVTVESKRSHRKKTEVKTAHMDPKIRKFVIDNLSKFMRIPLDEDVPEKMQEAFSDYANAPIKARKWLAQHNNLLESTQIRQAQDPQHTVRMETARFGSSKGLSTCC